MDIFRYIGSIDKLAQRRKRQFVREKEFDTKGIKQVNDTCGLMMGQAVLLARSKLNRHHTEAMTEISILDKFKAYREFLDAVDKFDSKLEKAMVEINNCKKCNKLSEIVKLD